MRSKAGIQTAGVWLAMCFAATAMAQQGGAISQALLSVDMQPAPALRADAEKNAAPPPSAGSGAAADTPLQWHPVRFPGDKEGKLASAPGRHGNQLVAERGPDGTYRVRHADDLSTAAPEPTP